MASRVPRLPRRVNQYIQRFVGLYIARCNANRLGFVTNCVRLHVSKSVDQYRGLCILFFLLKCIGPHVGYLVRKLDDQCLGPYISQFVT